MCKTEIVKQKANMFIGILFDLLVCSVDIHTTMGLVGVSSAEMVSNGTSLLLSE